MAYAASVSSSTVNGLKGRALKNFASCSRILARCASYQDCQDDDEDGDREQEKAEEHPCAQRARRAIIGFRCASEFAIGIVMTCFLGIWKKSATKGVNDEDDDDEVHKFLVRRTQQDDANKDNGYRQGAVHAAVDSLKG